MRGCCSMAHVERLHIVAIYRYRKVSIAMNARELKAKRKRMRTIVAVMQKYVEGYDKQPHYEDYSDETFISDMLYGIGIALDGRYTFANGFREWKLKLREHLENDPERTPSPHGDAQP